MDVDGFLRDLSRSSRRTAYVLLGAGFLIALARWCWRALVSAP
jgi:hypothetical protein